MTMENVEGHVLDNSDSLRLRFEDKLRDVVVAESGEGVAKEDVQIHVQTNACGSTSVTATVLASTSAAEAVRHNMSSNVSLGSRLCQTVSAFEKEEEVALTPKAAMSVSNVEFQLTESGFFPSEIHEELAPARLDGREEEPDQPRELKPEHFQGRRTSLNGLSGTKQYLRKRCKSLHVDDKAKDTRCRSYLKQRPKMRS